MTPRPDILAVVVLIGGTVLSLVTFLHGGPRDVMTAILLAIFTSGVVAAFLGR